MNLRGRIFLSVDGPLFGELWRFAVGYLVVPTWRLLNLHRISQWTLLPFLLALLVALRVVPLVVRKALRFDPRVQAIWAERRRLAKRFDSYQWQKMFWIGLGLMAFSVRFPPRFASLTTLIAFCGLSGASGLAFWFFHRSRAEAMQPFTSIEAASDKPVPLGGNGRTV